MSSIKDKILHALENNLDVFYRVSDIRYRIRCPFCGDSQNDYRKEHMYLLRYYITASKEIVGQKERSIKSFWID